MPATIGPLSFRYQQALTPLAKKVDPSERGQFSKRLSELLTLLDFNTTLNQSMALTEILDILLFATMGETRASWAGVLLRASDASLKPAARRGAPDPDWAGCSYTSAGADELEQVLGPNDPEAPGPVRDLMASLGAHLVVPIRKGGNLIGLLVLGKPAFAPPSYTEGERAFSEALSISAAACIDNGRVYEELRELNRSLSLKIFQLHSLFDVTRELSRALDEGAVREVIMTSAMGHLLATRCLLILPDGAIKMRGFPLGSDELNLLRTRIRDLGSLTEDLSVDELEDESMRGLLRSRELERMVPLRSGRTFHGVLVIGRKANGKPLSREDMDFLRSLTAQGAASLDNLRLTREWVEKQKMEKELALAREIQRGLLPDQDPVLPGWDIAGINIPCLTVGGDYYDYIAGPDGRVGLAIADVSGKGTGPALLMANVQASLRALSGLGNLSLDVMLTRLNDQVYRITEANRYVTVFYGWLDPRTAELTYVNAGHCYPLLFRRDGEVERLVVGGPVIGLLPEVPVEVGKAVFRPGDMLVAYTDGLSEAHSPSDDEFEEERIIGAVRAAEVLPARDVVAKLVSAARIFAAEAGVGDDLTLMVVKKVMG